tara:strand:+ start:742 stop:2256 length:1515 start_codon:yes stop_codon:yes gene_type:complete
MATEFKKIQKVSYGSSVGTSTDAFNDLFQGASHTNANKIENLKNINIKNIGDVAVEVKLDINEWTQATPDADGDPRYLYYLLGKGDNLYLPNLRLVSYNQGNASSGCAYLLNNQAISTNLYTDSTWTLGANLEDTETEVTVNASTHDFYVGDLIQVGINTTTATRIEIMEITAISGATLTVSRALYGTSAADKDSQTNGTSGAVSGAKIYLPYFNIQSNSSHYNGYSTAQTDGTGIFHVKNFFGYGRYTNSVAGGLTMGSISGKFYTAGYQELGLSGITSTTNTGLTASTSYEFDIQVDGATNFDNLTFTTDSSNVNFGGANGVISKIQSALDTQYYTSGNLFEKKVNVGIVNGDIRFTSGSRLSSSAIALTAGSSGTAEFFGTGRIPAAANIDAAVGAKLPNDVIYDNASGVEVPNQSELFYDDGDGNIQGACSGTINYSTGELRLTGCPPNANFVISANYGSAASGGVRVASAGSQNSIYEISARSLNHKVDGLIEIEAIEK